MATDKYTPVSGIYVIRNTKNGKVYIGKTKDLRGRWRGHQNKLKHGCHPNIYMQRVWDKHGEGIFEFKVLEYLSVEELNEREIHHIAIYKKRGLCYNLTDGGEGTAGIVFSAEHRKKIGEANRKRIVTPDTRRKMSESSRDFKHTSESRRKIGEANRRRIVTPETREKISNARKGKTPPNKGKPHTAESRLKMSEIAKKRPPISEETKRKISERLKGRVFSDKHLQNMREASKRRFSSIKDEESQD